jgi:hypothetical protein
MVGRVGKRREKENTKRKTVDKARYWRENDRGREKGEKMYS